MIKATFFILVEYREAALLDNYSICSPLNSGFFYPPSQKATGVNPWMNAKRVILRAYSAEVASATKAGSLGEGGYASAGFAEVCEDAMAVKPWSFTRP